MERTHAVTAITLRGHALKEADKILVLLSRDQGLLRAVAKGVRKPKSRMAGHLEPLRENAVFLASGRNLDVIAQVEGMRAWPAISRDFDALAAAMSACELLEAFLAEGDPVPEIYDLFVELLDVLGPGVNAEVLLTGFELQLLDALGYRPELTYCLGCERALETPRDAGALLVEAGGVLCASCAVDADEGAGLVRRLSPGAYQLLCHLQEAPLAQCGGITGPARLFSACRQLLREYSSFRAERELRAQTMFDWAPLPLPDASAPV